MPNHYHLFIKQTTDDKTISKFVSDLSNSFTKGMNKKYKRSGVLFESKIKSKWIEDETYFKWVIKYILVNPVKAGLVKQSFDYEYSSAKELFGMKEETIMDVKTLLSYFDSLNSLKEFIMDEKFISNYEI